MPVYEYECKVCKYKFEEAQGITEDKLVTCPKCKEKELQRLISFSTFKLVGTGWTGKSN